jgi:nucleolar GTP-binding protein
LFSNKPLVLVANKVDVKKIADLSEETQEMLMNFVTENNVELIETSTLTEDGIALVKEKACAKLLAQRVEMKIKSKNVDGLMNRLHVAVPRARDNKVRDSTIPQSVLERRAQKLQKMADLEEKARAEMNIVIGGPMSTDIDLDWDPQAYDTEDLRGLYLANWLLFLALSSNL